jgi:hypothetical protein
MTVACVRSWRRRPRSRSDPSPVRAQRKFQRAHQGGADRAESARCRATNRSQRLEEPEQSRLRRRLDPPCTRALATRFRARSASPFGPGTEGMRPGPDISWVAVKSTAVSALTAQAPVKIGPVNARKAGESPLRVDFTSSPSRRWMTGVWATHAYSQSPVASGRTGMNAKARIPLYDGATHAVAARLNRMALIAQTIGTPVILRERRGAIRPAAVGAHGLSQWKLTDRAQGRPCDASDCSQPPANSTSAITPPPARPTGQE